MISQQKLREYQRRNIPSPGDPQRNEAWSLVEAARRMAAVVEFGDLTTAVDRRKLRDALRLNLRLWTIIQAEQFSDDRRLPDDLRRNILTLCQFIDKHTIQQMCEPTAEGVVVLININRNIALGLLGAPDDSVLDEAKEKAAAAASDPAADAQKPAARLEIDT